MIPLTLLLQIIAPLLAGAARVPTVAPEAAPAPERPNIDPVLLTAVLAAVQKPVEPLPPVRLPAWIGALGILICLGFFGLLGAVVWMRIQGHGESIGDLQFALGLLSAAFITVVGFAFGSSWGSRSKDARLPAEPAGSPIILPGPLAPLPSVVEPVTPVEPNPVEPEKPTGQTGPLDAAPPWFKWAMHEVGTHEDAGNTGPAISRYCELAHAGALGDPWCAIFANAAIESVGIPGTRSASSQSFRSSADFVKLDGPALGAIAVFWRGSKSSGLGHVGFYRGEDASRVWVLGGNESDMVQIEALAKESGSFGLIGYWWPKGATPPTVGAVAMPSGSPASIQTDSSNEAVQASAPGALQTGITATIFANPGDSVVSRTSAYTGKLIDADAVGVALPFHFPGDRKRIRVFNRRAGLQVDADILDVGPWNTNDPYWTTGSRPQSESGTDTRGRKTNRAGIDLTLAAAMAIKIDGKGLVDWEFIS